MLARFYTSFFKNNIHNRIHVPQALNKSMLNFPDEYTGTPENIARYKQLLGTGRASNIRADTPSPAESLASTAKPGHLIASSAKVNSGELGKGGENAGSCVLSDGGDQLIDQL